jgi:hypothetical protein
LINRLVLHALILPDATGLLVKNWSQMFISVPHLILQPTLIL